VVRRVGVALRQEELVVRLLGRSVCLTNRAGVLPKWVVRLPNQGCVVTNRSLVLTKRWLGRTNGAEVLTKAAECGVRRGLPAMKQAKGGCGLFVIQPQHDAPASGSGADHSLARRADLRRAAYQFFRRFVVSETEWICILSRQGHSKIAQHF